MKKHQLGATVRRMAVLFLCLGGATIGSRAATILTNNLNTASSGSDSVSGSLLLGANFSTDSISYSLNSATLVLQEDTGGVASVYLYSDGGGIPGSLLGTLTSPASYSSTLADTVFTASGLSLSANTTYWLVLGASSGAFEWSWTSTNSGTGVGYTGDSAYFDGAYWYGTSGVYPYQLNVAADPAGASTVPEPASFGLLVAGSLGAMALASRDRFRGKQI